MFISKREKKQCLPVSPKFVLFHTVDYKRDDCKTVKAIAVVIFNCIIKTLYRIHCSPPDVFIVVLQMFLMFF